MNLCPWFLKKVLQSHKKSLQEEGIKASLARPFNSVMNPPDGLDDGILDTPSSSLTSMDVAATFERALLHEMTHAILDGRTYDEGGFGWKKCTATSPTPKSIINADNYAFFAIAARMISPPKNGAEAQRPGRDGSIQTLSKVKDSASSGSSSSAKGKASKRDFNYDPYPLPIQRRVPNDTTVKPSTFQTSILTPKSTSSG